MLRPNTAFDASLFNSTHRQRWSGVGHQRQTIECGYCRIGDHITLVGDAFGETIVSAFSSLTMPRSQRREGVIEHVIPHPPTQEDGLRFVERPVDTQIDAALS